MDKLNSKLVLLFLVFFFSCSKKTRYIDIPYPQAALFYDFFIPTDSYIDFIYKNKIASVDLVINGDTIKGFHTFDEEGRIKTRKDFNGRNESVYDYEDGYLVRVRNPERFFRIGFVDDVTFSYRDGEVYESQIFFKGQMKAQTFFVYDVDSITSSTRGVGDEEPFQLDAYKYKKGKLLYEVHRKGDDIYEIDNTFRNDSLVCQNWKFNKYDAIDIDSLNTDGLIFSSLHRYSDGGEEKTLYTYSESTIQEFRYSEGKLISYVCLLLNKHEKK